MLKIPNCLIFIMFLICGLLAFSSFPDLEKVFIYFRESMCRKKQKVVRFINYRYIDVILLRIMLLDDFELFKKSIFNLWHVDGFITHQMRYLVNGFYWVLSCYSEFLRKIIVLLSEVPRGWIIPYVSTIIQNNMIILFWRENFLHWFWFQISILVPANYSMRFKVFTWLQER